MTTEKFIITSENLGLDFIWNGIGLTVNISHSTNHDVTLDCMTIHKPTMQNFRACVKRRIKDYEAEQN